MLELDLVIIMLRGEPLKRKQVLPINFINLAVVIIVTVFVALLTQNVIKELTIRDIQNVTRLTQTNIYADLNQELMEPVNTSIIMAQNTLLFGFMDQDTPETEAKIANYLTAVQKATGYESAFIIPHSTLNYYHPGGTDAKVDLNSEDAFWYTARIHAKDAYALVVNTEQLDDYALTVYVDANINDKNGKFLGIAGVGKRITHLQDLLTNYLDKQGVEAYLTDNQGLVLVHQDSQNIKKTSFYDLEGLKSENIDIQISKSKPLEKLINNQFYIIQYIPMLDWFLVVKKSSSDLTGLLNQYSIKVTAALIVGAIIILLVTNYVISRYKKQIIQLSNIDHLTDIPNRTIFEIVLHDAIKNSYNQVFCLALFDLDNLKAINDNFGHDKGDDILQHIAQIAKETFGSPHCVSRIGGDEFGLILYMPLKESEERLELFQSAIENHEVLKCIKTTVSIGMTKCESDDTKSSIFKRADEALYRSKNAGKNKIHVS